MSDTQDYIEYIIKKHETLTTIHPIHVYVNSTSNRLVFKMKDGYKLELQTSDRPLEIEDNVDLTWLINK